MAGGARLANARGSVKQGARQRDSTSMPRLLCHGRKMILQKQDGRTAYSSREDDLAFKLRADGETPIHHLSASLYPT